MKVIRLSLQEFAQPAPRRGHLAAQRGHSLGMQRGMEIHHALQKRRKADFANYAAEVKITHRFEVSGHQFIIEGRMDGLFSGTIPRIEEIKSDFNLSELQQELSADCWNHAYGLQLLSYGYFYFKNTGVLPELSMLLVSSRRWDERELQLSLDVEKYEAWLENRLKHLVEEVQRSLKRVERRKKTLNQLSFPFAPREGQRELMHFITKGMEQKKHLLLQAPTGLGKTIGVIFPALKEAFARGSRLIYVTPKNSQQQLAVEAIQKLQDQGAQIKNMVLSAKSKLCLKSEMLCRPEYCEYARDYYQKLHQHELAAVLARKRKLTGQSFQELGKKYEVCPYELQFEAIAQVDVIIGDYNHVFSRHSKMGMHPSLMEEGLPNLAIDEAHNLPQRAMGYFSPSLSVPVLLQMRHALEGLPPMLRVRGMDIISDGIKLIDAHSGTGDLKLRLKTEAFEKVQERIKNFLFACLESGQEISQGDVAFSLYNYWAAFVELLLVIVSEEQTEFLLNFRHEKGGSSLNIICCDASRMIQERYQAFEQVIAFSATLKPFSYYAQLTGLESDRLLTAEFKSPYDPAKRKLLIIPQISTKFSERARNYQRIAEAITRISALRSGNYLAFFPAFDFMQKTAEYFIPPAGYKFLQQARQMKSGEIENVLAGLKAQDGATILFAVQGGSFAEGVDYLGEMVIGAFVIGPPLPSFDQEREAQKGYYQTNYQAGFAYTYAYPAMAKAVQAAGRVIRSDQDRGLIVLMDDRFLLPEYAQSMPADWFETSPRELVSQSILGDVREFWDGPRQ